VVLAQHETTRLQHSGAPQARWINDAIRFYIEFHREQEGLDGCIVNDVLPIAALLNPAALSFESSGWWWIWRRGSTGATRGSIRTAHG